MLSTPYPKENDGIKRRTQPIPRPMFLVLLTARRMKIVRGPTPPKRKCTKKLVTCALP